MVKVILDDGTIVHTKATTGKTGSGGQLVEEKPVQGGTKIVVTDTRGGGSGRRGSGGSRSRRVRQGETYVVPQGEQIRTMNESERQLERLSQTNPRLALAVRQQQQRQKASDKAYRQTLALQSRAQKKFEQKATKQNLGPGSYRVVEGGQEFFFTLDYDKPNQSMMVQADIDKLNRGVQIKPGPQSLLSFDDRQKVKLYQDTKGMSAIEKRLYVLDRQREDLLAQPKSVTNAAQLILNSGVRVVGGITYLFRHPVKTGKGLADTAQLILTQPGEVVKKMTNGLIRDPLGVYVEWIAAPAALSKGASLAFKGSRIARPAKSASIVYKVSKKAPGGVSVRGYAIGKLTPAKIAKLKAGKSLKVRLQSVIKVRRQGKTKIIRKNIDQQVKLTPSSIAKMNEQLSKWKKDAPKRLAKEAKKQLAQWKPVAIEYSRVMMKLEKYKIDGLPPLSTFKKYTPVQALSILKIANKELTASRLRSLSEANAKVNMARLKQFLKQRITQPEEIPFSKRLKALSDDKKRSMRFSRRAFPRTQRYDLLDSPLFRKEDLRAELRAAIQTKDSTRYAKAINNLDRLARQVNNASRNSQLYAFNDPVLVAVVKLQEKVVEIASKGSTQAAIIKAKSAVTKLKNASRTKIKTTLTLVSKASRLLSKATAKASKARYASAIAAGSATIMSNLIAIRVADAVTQSLIHVQGVKSGSIAVTKQILTPTQKPAYVPASIQVPKTATSLAKVAAVSALVTGLSSAAAATYFTKPSPVARKISSQSGGGFIVPKTFGARYRTLQRYRYLPDLDSLIFGRKASSYERQVLTQVGRVFSGVEARKLV